MVVEVGEAFEGLGGGPDVEHEGGIVAVGDGVGAPGEQAAGGAHPGEPAFAHVGGFVDEGS